MRLLVVLFALATTGSCQENAGTGVAPSLIECYNQTAILTRDCRLPATLESALDLIRKIESAHPNQNSEEVAIELLHRFRQDGIKQPIQDTSDDPNSIGIPFSPRGHEANRNRVILKKVLPGNALQFQNDSLSAIERCSLHYMISTTTEGKMRGDEDRTCSISSKYQRRIRRAGESEWLNDNGNTKTGKSMKNLSKCPIESGVVWTKFGTVAFGELIAGIAAGFKNMIIPTDVSLKADGIYASTIAGVLAEAALYSSQIGRSGGWNSTINQKYYFLQESTSRTFLSDAKIRGAIDGFYLGQTIKNQKDVFNKISIADILSMYYSSKGVLNSTVKACNRKIILTDFLTVNELNQQTESFIYILDDEAIPDKTIPVEQYSMIANKTVDQFWSYFASLTDAPCDTEERVTERVSTDLIIFIDTTWDYRTITNVIGSLLNGLNVNNLYSNYEIFNGATLEVLVNSSNHVGDFFAAYNRTVHDKQTKGFNFQNAISTLENIILQSLKNQSFVGGKSIVGLFMTTTSPSSSDNSYFKERRDVLSKKLPDLNLLVLTSQSSSSFNVFVPDSKNIVNLQDNSDSYASAVDSLKSNIKSVPKNLVNPQCLTTGVTGNTVSLTQFIDSSGISSIRIANKYIKSSSVVRVKEEGYGTLQICFSRTSKPTNDTNSDCRIIKSNETTYSGYSGDLYMGVYSFGSNGGNKCNDRACQYPDDVKFTVILQDADCSGVGSIISTASLVIAAAVAVIATII